MTSSPGLAGIHCDWITDALDLGPSSHHDSTSQSLEGLLPVSMALRAAMSIRVRTESEFTAIKIPSERPETNSHIGILGCRIHSNVLISDPLRGAIAVCTSARLTPLQPATSHIGSPTKAHGRKGPRGLPATPNRSRVVRSNPSVGWVAGR